jgi:hypothetical protein
MHMDASILFPRATLLPLRLTRCTNIDMTGHTFMRVCQAAVNRSGLSTGSDRPVTDAAQDTHLSAVLPPCTAVMLYGCCS